MKNQTNLLQFPATIVTLVYDIAHSVGPRSDGGRKVTEAEALKIAEDALRLGELILAFVSARSVEPS